MPSSSSLIPPTRKTGSQPSQQFALTSLDKEILTHCEYDIGLWMTGYFDGVVFPYQQYFYHAPQRDKMLVAAIRTGKSELASFGFLHYMQFHPGSQLLNTSISSEQAKIVYNNCLRYCSAPRFSHWVDRVQSSPYPLIRLVNGATAHFRSIGYDAELIRGFEFDLINVDEAAYVTREAAITTLKGRLLGVNPQTGRPRAGLFWQISSPKGKGWLFERWKKGDPKYSIAQPQHYLSLRATIWDNPLLSEEQIKQVMEDYTDAMIRQELYGEFVEDMDAIFPYHLFMAGCEPMDPSVKALYREIEAYNDRMVASGERRAGSIRGEAGLTEDITHYECEPRPGHRYVSSWDLGKKTTRKGRNAMVGMVYDITHEPWTQVAFLYREGMGYVEVKAKIEEWHAKYSYSGASCKTVIDSTGKGDVLEEFIEREQTVDDLEGIVYSEANKPNLVHAGKLAVERGLTRYPFIKRMADQFTNYVIYDKEIAQDIVMTYCQAMYTARDMTRISEAQPYTLQQRLNTRPQGGIRSSQARRSVRYIESRMARRRTTPTNTQRGGSRR